MAGARKLRSGVLAELTGGHVLLAHVFEIDGLAAARSGLGPRISVTRDTVGGRWTDDPGATMKEGDTRIHASQ